MADLHVLDMSVTWRNILDLGSLSVNYFKNLKEIEKKLVQDKIIPNPDEQFTTLSRVSQTVCSLISPKKIFVPLFPMEVLSLPNIERLSIDQIKKKIEKSTWEQISIYLLIHKSGVGMFKYLSHCDQKQTIEEAIRTVRKGIQPLVIKIPNGYYWDVEKDYIKVIEKGETETTLVTTLRDLSTFFLNKYVRDKFTAEYIGGSFGKPRSSRCISTTMIEVYKTDPSSDSIQEFLQLDKSGRELRGIGSMDLAYGSRADRLVQTTFEKNFSDDEELHFYLMGLSDFLIYDNKTEKLVAEEKKRLKLGSDYLVMKYISYHYECLMDWVYMEQYLIRMYDMLLSHSMAGENIKPREMLELQKNSMRDLIEYNEGITPFATRADILEQSRLMYRIPEEQERLEKKRDMVTEYVMQEYSLRTNRGIQVLNLIVSATIAFELMQLIIQIAESSSAFGWSIASSIVFVLLLGIFAFSYVKVVGR